MKIFFAVITFSLIISLSAQWVKAQEIQKNKTSELIFLTRIMTQLLAKDNPAATKITEQHKLEAAYSYCESRLVGLTKQRIRDSLTVAFIQDMDRNTAAYFYEYFDVSAIVAEETLCPGIKD